MNRFPILLDTHCWIWLQMGETKHLQPKTRRVIQHAAVSGDLVLSVISIWELGMLESKGRLRFTMPCERWVQEALAVPGLTVAPITPEIALASSRLPGDFHGDPADRLLVATARSLGAKLATLDERMIEYANRQHLTVV